MDQNQKRTLRILLMVIAAIAMAACGAAPTPEPTPDMNAFATSAVQTIEAQYTETAIAMPTNTPEPTYTPVSLPTEVPETVLVLPTSASSDDGQLLINPAAESTASDSALPVILPQASAAENQQLPEIVTVPTATPIPAGGDKASYDSQTPNDGAHVEAGSEFDITWYLLNTGTTTWTTDYCLRYFTGTNFTKPGKDRYYLNNPVLPNDVGACTIDAVAPWNPGTYTMSVVLGNENDENFFIVDITIVVD